MSWVHELAALFRMPRVTVDLMYGATAANDPFFAKITREFYVTTQRRHWKLPLFRCYEFGVALCRLPRTGKGYQELIEAAGRRNLKKAQRLGFTFQPIDHDRYLDDIRGILQSTTVRQGRVPDAWLEGAVRPCRNPPTRSDVHDYPYFGVLKDGRLVAYAGCFICGEVAMVEHVLGHAEHLRNGVVPMLFIGMAEEVVRRYPRVQYYAYGTYFGGGKSLRRFKTKFAFLPHRVKWVLDGKA